jgi:hypothetical protein
MPEFKSEKAFQKALVHRIITVFPRCLFFSTGVGAMNTGRTVGAAFKQFGYVAGFPDLFFLEPQSVYHGFGLELKTKNGRQSEAQKSWESALELRKYAYFVAKDFGTAWEIIEKWMRNAEYEHGALIGSGQIRRASKARKPKGKGWK